MNAKLYLPAAQHSGAPLLLSLAFCLFNLVNAAVGAPRPYCHAPDQMEVDAALSASASSQASTSAAAQPPSSAHQPQRVLALPALSPSVIGSLQAKPPEQLKGRLQIGVNRTFEQETRVNGQTVGRTEWQQQTNGDWVWSVQVLLPGALGMRLHLEDLYLLSGVKLIVRTPEQSSQAITPIEDQTLHGQTELWTETVFGDTAILECHVPSTVDPSRVSFALKELSHIYTFPLPGANLKEGSCEVDVSCYPSWAQEASGVARMSFVDQGGTYLCTGCLLSSSTSSSADYFLTAHHCITSSSIASTIELYWFYQTTSCNGGVPALTNVPHTSGGADLLASSSTSDFSFMRLRQTAPAGAARLDWSTAIPASGTHVTGIHHPGGAYKRISFGTFIGSDPSYWHVQWSSGVTEPGSSGSPLFNANGQVVGQLTGGYNGPGSSCSDPTQPDEYGRFDVTYPSIQSWIGSGGPDSGGFQYTRATYNGLFSVSTGGVDPASAGSFSLATTTQGRFSGKLQFAAGTYSFSGQLDGNGAASVRVPRGMLRTLTVQLQVDPDTQNSISGTVSDDYWTADIDAQRVVYDGRSNSSPEAGQYTFVVPGDGYGVTQPGGDSFGSVKIDRAGHARVTCALADTTKLSLSSTVSSDGRAPLFARLYGGHGVFLTWMTFGSGAGPDVSGDVSWIKNFVPNAKYYPSGFEVNATMTGDLFTRPPAGTGILDLSDGKLSLQGGGLDRPVTDHISFGTANKVLDLNSNKLSLTISASTGSFSGRWTDPDTGKPLAVTGIVLEKQNRGAGFFTGLGGSGQVGIGQ